MAREGLILDTLDLNDGVVWDLESFEINPPEQRLEFLTNPDIDGGFLPDDEVRYENREATARVRVIRQASMDLALERAGELLDKLQECRRVRGGLPMTWSPAASTKTGTLYVLVAEIPELPISVDGDDAGWLVKAPIFEVKFTCRPAIYGARVNISPVTSTAALFESELAGVLGDLNAEGEVILTDDASQERNHVELGLEHALYDPVAPWDLLLTGADFNITDTSATYNAGADSVDLEPILPTWADVGIIPDLANRGSFRARAEVLAETPDVEMRLRLLYRTGGMPFKRNSEIVAPSFDPEDWADVDLGVVHAPEGAGQLDLLPQVFGAEASSVDGLRIRRVYLIPTERYVRARGVQVQRPGAISGFDDFSDEAEDAVIAATVAPVGGTWAGAGDLDDFKAVSGSAYRTIGTDSTALDDWTGRFLILGATNFTATTVIGRLDVGLGNPDEDEWTRVGLVARYVDVNNWLAATFRVRRNPNGGVRQHVQLHKSIAGTVTTLDSVDAKSPLRVQKVPVGSGTGGIAAPRGIRGALAVKVDAAGNVEVSVGSRSALETTSRVISVLTDSDLATGGVLDDGLPGFYGEGNTTGTVKQVCTEWYVTSDETLTANSPVIPVGGTATFTHEKATNEDAAANLSRVPRARGSRIWIPPAGDQDRTSRVVAKVRRLDVDNGAPVVGEADSTIIEAGYTPRYLVFPR